MTKYVTLSYNGEHDMVVNREKLANSCHYFRKLLSGEYIERNQDRIEIFLEGLVPLDIFQDVINYADKGILDRRRPIKYYVRMLKLAHIWIYDTLMDDIQIHLINKIDMDTIVRIHTAANLLDLKRLQRECLRFERIVDRNPGSVIRFWRFDPPEQPPLYRTSSRF